MIDCDLEEQRTLVDSFNTWFESSGSGGTNSRQQGGSYKGMIDDSRRRYRMQRDTVAQKRHNANLSSLPSTKSMSIVDHAVEQFLSIYHDEPDAISYSARNISEINEKKARWFSELFNWRAKRTAKFYQWHRRSLQSGLVDGIECAFVSWIKESFTEDQQYTDAEGNPVDEDEYAEMGAIAPQNYVVNPETEHITRDTWWIEQLMPGETVFWDMTAPGSDVQLGQWCLVKLPKTEDQMRYLGKVGVFDLYDEGKEDEYEGIKLDEEGGRGRITANPFDGDEEHCEVWAFFYKENFRWYVQFSSKGEDELSTWKPIDDVFWGGRRENLLPVVIGYSNPMLWESMGRGIPQDIAPLDDEYNNNRNNLQDAANAALQKKYMVQRGSNVDIDQLIHRPVVYADAGEVTELSNSVNIMDTLRATDALQSDISEISPAGVMARGRSVVPNGTDQTLGALQMTMSDSGGKLNVMLRTRNETFLEPILYRVAKLIQAFETDENVLAITAQKAGMHPEMVLTSQGPMIDPRELDIDFDASINAGMGQMPKYQKTQVLMQMADWRVSHGIATDMDSVARQLMTIAGLDPDAYTPKQAPQPPPPKVDYKASVAIDLVQLPPEAQQALLNLMMSGGMDITAKVDGDNPQAKAAQDRLSQAAAQRTGVYQTPNSPVDSANNQAAQMGMAPKMETGAMNAQ